MNRRTLPSSTPIWTIFLLLLFISVASFFEEIFWGLESEIVNFPEYFQKPLFSSTCQQSQEENVMTHHLCDNGRKFPRQFSLYLQNESDKSFSKPSMFSLLGSSIEVNLENSSVLIKLLFYTEVMNNLTSVTYLDMVNTTHCFCATGIHLPDLQLELHTHEQKSFHTICNTKENFLPKVARSKELVLYCNFSMQRQDIVAIIGENEILLELREPNARLHETIPVCTIKPFTRSIANLLPYRSLSDYWNRQKRAQQTIPIERMVACSQPLYNVDYLESLWPGIMAFWVLHHLFIIGMSSFSIYDTDGSAEKYLKDFIRLGLVEYYPRFHLTYDLYHRTVEENRPYCAQTFIENHCLWSYRGLSEWVAFVHAPDLYLFDGTLGGTALYEYLQTLNESFVGLAWQLYDEIIDYQAINSIHQSIFDIFQLTVTETSVTTPTPLVKPHNLDLIYLHQPAYYFHSRLMMVSSQYPAKHFITLFNNRTYPSIQVAPGVHSRLAEIPRELDTELVKTVPWIRRAYHFLQWVLHCQEMKDCRNDTKLITI